MCPEGSRIRPFFDHRHHIWPGGWLAVEGIFQINGGSVLDAPFLGEDLRDKSAEQFQNIGSPPRGGADRGKYVNHRLDRRMACFGHF